LTSKQLRLATEQAQKSKKHIDIVVDISSPDAEDIWVPVSETQHSPTPSSKPVASSKSKSEKQKSSKASPKTSTAIDIDGADDIRGDPEVEGTSLPRPFFTPAIEAQLLSTLSTYFHDSIIVRFITN
jgi:hypothetical protein